ncbi:MAG: 7-alpha-hydroxysteroid dehydrogenase [Nitrosomonadaceae bacterium]|nr:7-alpha-hydroxysteroid dehydrogenase [Nitrosomonadaceae bacterium]
MRTESLERNLPPDWVPKIAKQIPLQRLGRPKEIGEAVVFLASEAAGYVNGAVLDINGGRTEYVFS